MKTFDFCFLSIRDILFYLVRNALGKYLNRDVFSISIQILSRVFGTRYYNKVSRFLNLKTISNEIVKLSRSKYSWKIFGSK